MGAQHTRDFSDPDDTVSGNGLVSRRIGLGAHSVSYAHHEPGWRWSANAPLLGAPASCQTHHVGYAIAGRIRVRLDDGTEFDVTAGSVFDIPPGHDAWVVGDSAYEAIDWVGARSWLANTRNTSTVLATILFSDVVDSSSEVRRRGDVKWSDINSTLAERTRDVATEFGGNVIKSTGDGSLVMFGGAGRAIQCGLELAAAAPHLGLAIRVGIHTGEVEFVAGDVHGLTVHEAARVLATAAPGEVLVSEVTKAIAGDLEITFRDRGDHELKGIGSRRLFAATKSG